MRILFFSSYFAPYISGLVTWPQRVMTGLVKSSPDIKFSVGTFRFEPKLSTTAAEKNIFITRLNFLFRLSKGFISPQSWFWFGKQIKSHDVVWLNLPCVESLPLAFLAKITGKPIISLCHCEIDLGQAWSQRLLSWVVNWFTQLQLQMSQKVVVSSRDYWQASRFAAVVPAEKVIEVVPDAELSPASQIFWRTLQAKKKSQFWIGVVGRLAREKGIEVLIESWRYLSPQLRDNAEIIVAGPDPNAVIGEENWGKSLVEHLHQAKIPVRFLGSLSTAELAAFYKSINVLVVPATNKTEAFGLVQLEAMLLGTPVVASNMPGVRVPVRSTGYGQLFKTGDAQSLADAINQVLKTDFELNPLTNTYLKAATANSSALIWAQIFASVGSAGSQTAQWLKSTAAYLSNRPFFFAFIRPIESQLMRQAVLSFPGKVLDFGCGDGFFTDVTLGDKLAGQIVGYDLANSRVQAAKKRRVYSQILVSDDEKIPVQNELFDVVMANSVLEHVDPLTNNLAEIHRVLKPGGHGVFTVMTDQWDKRLLGRKLFGVGYADWLRKQQAHAQLLSVSEWEQVFKQTGFSIEETVGYLNQKTSWALEIAHYFSGFSLMTHRLFGRWVLWPDWWRVINPGAILKSLGSAAVCPVEQAGSVLIVVKKTNKNNWRCN